MPSSGDDCQDTMTALVQQTAKMLEARRNKELAKKMAKLMKNCNYDVLLGEAEVEQTQMEVCDETDVEDEEEDQLRKLQDLGMLEGGGGATQEGCAKYEAPLITKLRAVETVDELYRLADHIVRCSAKEI